VSFSQSRSASISNDYVGVVAVALDHYLTELAARAQHHLATPGGSGSDAQFFADTRYLWDATAAARREVLS
jgi:hypothetical protein